MNDSPPDNPFVLAASNPMVPWHMWGGTIALDFTSVGVVTSDQRVSRQVAKISYKRPESWTFFFGVNVIGLPPVSDSALVFNVNLTMGIGRTFFEAKNFGEFVFETTAGNPWGAPKWTGKVNTPQLSDGLATSVHTIDRFCAQDIQVSASLLIDTLPANYVLRSEVTALFAPVAHVRPDWFSEGEQFRGDEIGGT